MRPRFAIVFWLKAKPEGRITRGFTTANRLRLVDTYVLLALRERLHGRGALFVDVGYGAEPITTSESFTRFRTVNPAVQAIGVEIEPSRVAAAGPYAREGMEFRLGGFNLPLFEGEQPTLVRAFNVLRQYGEGDVRDALWSLGCAVPPGAILIEGTSDPLGRMVCFWVWERGNTAAPRHARRAPPFERKWLVFGARLVPEFRPRAFQAVLPKELIHHAEPGGALDRFFAAWEHGWDTAAGRARRERWAAGAQRLADQGYAADRRRRIIDRSLLAVRAESFAGALGAG